MASKTETVQGQNTKALVAIAGVIGLLVGVVMTTVSFDQRDLQTTLVGALVMAGSVWLIVKAIRMPADGTTRQTIFRLTLVTNAGEVAAYETASASEMSEVEDALEQAMLDARQ